MSFTWGEVCKWSKSHNFKVSKKDGLFCWVKLDDPKISGQESNLDDMVKAIFNEITDHKWIEHQKTYHH